MSADHDHYELMIIDLENHGNLEKVVKIENSKTELNFTIDQNVLFQENSLSKVIAVEIFDFLTLERHQYLSGIVIDLYLNHIYNEIMDSDLRNKTIIFPTDFYTFYTARPKNDQTSADQDQYDRIVDFLSPEINVLDKNFVVVPALENNHWFLFIICNTKSDGKYESYIWIFDSLFQIGDPVARFKTIKGFMEQYFFRNFSENFEYIVKRAYLPMVIVINLCFLLHIKICHFLASTADKWERLRLLFARICRKILHIVIDC
jgi:Ulp1 family protease